MKLRHPPQIASASVLSPAPWKRHFVGAIFAVLYSISCNLWYTTAGEPYEWALQEQKKAVREKAAEIKEKGVSFESGSKESKEKELEIDYESLPSPHLPSALSCAFIFLNVSAHILFHLMCHWSIGFKANMLFQRSDKVRKGLFMRLTPHANKGSADICKIEESEVTLKFHFTFQYQAYECIAADVEDADLIGGEKGAWGIRLIHCPTNLRWSEYMGAKGLKTDSEVELAQDKYGTNIFELPRPTFMDLFKKQLMAPLAIFQFATTALWMLDTYWKYTCFTLMSVLGFEASTAFQRLKSMSTLRGMSTKTYDVYVYRQLRWQQRPIEDLLPGDIMSLCAKKPEEKSKDGEAVDKKAADANKHLVVPCDCLLLRGSAIVNEATLTGESVPQMKDALSANDDATATVDAFNKHRIHALFSGTSLIQVTPAQKSLTSGSKEEDAMCPPDDGVVCYVLRTGFNSSQGELMRMIEFSTQDVGSDKIETALQLLFLLMFALVAAGYVLKKGLEDPTRPTYKTLLRCTLIITSVVPPSLPMQMAFAVHTALMALLKTGIFCTEPFRVPFAGKVSYCFFDKTGTLTSDQMIAVGIVNADGGKEPKDPDGTREALPPKQASTMTAMCVAGCHSLIEVEGKAIGDPIEVAALQGVQWSYLPGSATASPGAWRNRELFGERQREFMAALRDDIEADKKEKAELTQKLSELDKTLKQEKAEALKLQCTIEQRFHFSSELQRMSTICRVKSQGACQAGAYCLTKGSPEAIGMLLASKPKWYDATYTSMAEKGQRVLALAYRHLGDVSAASEYAKKPRSDAECKMTFAGFIAFKCETRKDSGLVIKALLDSKHACIMLTGDAPLTALSVAHEVGIATLEHEKALLLTETADGGVQWTPAITSNAASKSIKPVAFDAAGLEKLRESHDLVITGKSLELLLKRPDADTAKAVLHHVGVYARLSPAQKEQIIHSVKKFQDACTLMCGDGGNDVGALKEADVGLALLSGFGNANVDKAGGSELATQDGAATDAEEALEIQRKENVAKQMEIGKKAKEEMERKRKDLMGRQQQWVEEEMEARRQRGEDCGIMGQMSAMKTVMGRLKDEIKKEQDMLQKKHGTAFAAGAAKWAGEMDQMDGGDMPMVQLGDASIAAPFTSRTPSISSCVDIIRQGRCTLLSAVQQMEIMMLESMISAYTMSTMSVDGTRPSEAQMMASGTLMSVASLAFSFARPLDRMHPVRPLGSVFHPAILFSMLGQLVIHLGCMVYIADLAKELMGPDAVKEIVEFEKERNKHIEGLDESTFDEWNWFMSVPFKSNLLNTCCWLVETSQQISVIFVNYKGRPWMKGLLENQPLFLSLFACIALVAICAWGAFPYLNTLLNLEVVPEELRYQVMGCLLTSLVGSFLWDRFMVMCFAPHIWEVMKDEAKATSVAHFMPLLKTVGMVGGGAAVLCVGNPILWMMAFWMYRNYKKADEAKPQAQAAAGRHQ